MINRSIEQLTQMIQLKNDVSEYHHVRINGVAFDTRLIKPGNLFVPLKGEQADGHDYVDKALVQGASAVLWQKDMPNPPENTAVLMVEDTLLALQQLAKSYLDQLNVKVIGITGSNGKTTTKDIAAAVFAQKYKVHKTEGNFNNHIGLPITVLSMPEETEVAILEMGMSQKGEISVLTKIARPDVAIITNIGEAHLQDLGSRQGIAEAKLEILEGLKDNGLFIYPGDEPLLANVDAPHSFTFGETANNEFYPVDIQMDEQGSSFSVPALSESSFYLPIAGKHNILNSLAVLLAARKLSISIESMKAGLKSVALSSMRMEWHDGVKNTKILNDAYNASPTSMKAVISMLESLNVERDKDVVLGDMLELGDQEINFHVQIGELINPENIKYVFTFGPLAQHIAAGARKNFPENRVFAFMDKSELITTLHDKISGNELILVKASRGMKLEEVVNSFVMEKYFPNSSQHNLG